MLVAHESGVISKYYRQLLWQLVFLSSVVALVADYTASALWAATIWCS